MANAFIEKLKRTIIEGATFSAAKAEEAARKGKVHLDILAEKRKLGNKFEALGRLTFESINNDSLGSLKESNQCIELLGEIKVIQDAIVALSAKQESTNS